MSKFDSDLQSAYENLLKDHGLDRTGQTVESLNEAREAMANAGWLDKIGVNGQHIQQEIRELSSNPLAPFNSMLADTAKDVEQSIRLRGAEPPRNVFVGCFPLADINACLKTVPEGSLVLVNSALMQIIYQIGKVFLLSYDWLCAGVDDDGSITLGNVEGTADAIETLANTLEWESDGWSKRDCIVAITAILNADRYHGSVSCSPRQKVPEGEKAITLGSIVTYAEFFVVAHEYAHLMLGHGTLAEVHTSTGSISDVLRVSREQEFEADELAASILFASGDWNSPNGEFDLNSRAASIALAFVGYSFHLLACRGPASFNLDADEMEDHPTPVRRICRVIEWLHGRYGRSVSGLARVCAGWQMLIIKEVASALDDLSKASSLEKEAQTLFEQKCYVEAGAAFRQVVDLRDSALGEFSLSVVAPLSNLANCLLDCGKVEEAEAASVRSLAICERVGSVAGKYLPQILENLAMHYAAMGDRDAAKPYFIRSVDEWEKQGPESIESFLHCCSAYLQWLLCNRLDTEVDSLGERVVEVLQRTYGDNHFKVRDAMHWNAKIREELLRRN